MAGGGRPTGNNVAGGGLRDTLILGGGGRCTGGCAGGIAGGGRPTSNNVAGGGLRDTLILGGGGRCTGGCAGGMARLMPGWGPLLVPARGGAGGLMDTGGGLAARGGAATTWSCVWTSEAASGPASAAVIGRAFVVEADIACARFAATSVE